MSDNERPQLHSTFRSAVPISVEAHGINERKIAPNGEEFDVKIVASTERVARDGGVVPMSAWAGGGTRAFLKNPVILFAHDGSKPPVAQAVHMELDTAKGRMVQWWRFHAGLTDDEHDRLANRLRALYSVGGMRAASIGFRIEKMRDPTEDEVAAAKKVKDRVPWWVAEKAELVETSAVPVPADPHALAIDRGLQDAERKGMDMACVRDAWKQCCVEATEPPPPPEEPNPVDVPDDAPLPVMADAARGDGPCVDDLAAVELAVGQDDTATAGTTTTTGHALFFAEADDDSDDFEVEATIPRAWVVLSRDEHGNTRTVIVDERGHELPRDQWPVNVRLPVRDEREPDLLDELYDSHLAIFGDASPQPRENEDPFGVGLDADTVRRIVREEVDRTLQRRRGVLPRHLR